MSTQPALFDSPGGSTAHEIVIRTEDLPPFPDVVWRVIDLASDPCTGARELERIIERDLSLTARVLRLANSAYFQRSREVKTVRAAAALLGNAQIRSLVLTAALKPMLSGSPLGRVLWEHSLAVALASRLITAALREGDSEEAFVAGLLHDVGKSLFDRQHPRLFAESVQLLRAQEGISSIDAEKRFLGLSHPEVGAIVAVFWRLPPSLSDVILHHHQPEASDGYSRLCAAVHLADLLALRLGIGLVQRTDVDPMATAAGWLLRVTPALLETVSQHLERELMEDKRQLGIQ